MRPLGIFPGPRATPVSLEREAGRLPFKLLKDKVLRRRDDRANVSASKWTPGDTRRLNTSHEEREYALHIRSFCRKKRFICQTAILREKVHLPNYDIARNAG